MNCHPSLRDVSKAPTLILSLLSSSENYTSLVLTISNMHALYTYATFLTRLKETNRSMTGNPGSVIVLQYGSSKITVFVWGKNTILKFL